MNMKHARYLLVGLAALGLGAQEAQSNPLYLGASVVLNQGDLRKFAGGKANSFAFEAGYTVLPVEEGIGLNLYGRYMRTAGDRKFGTGFPSTGVKLSLDTITLGTDFTFASPWKAVVPYIGLSLSYFDGAKSDPFQNPKLSFEDSKAKFGGRVGVLYQFNQRWSAAADYSYAEWRSVSNQPILQGVNPMNPSYVSLTARYHFSY